MNLADLRRADDAFGPRFFVIHYLPTYAGSVFLLILVWAGAPHRRLRFDRAWHTAAGLDLAQTLLITIAIALIAHATKPFQLALTRVFEGYWPKRLEPLSKLRRARFQHDYDRMERQTELGDADAAHTPLKVQSAGTIGAKQRRLYPQREAIKATALGNVLAALENRAGRDYGWDAVVTWPRLYPVLGDQVRATVDDRRDTLDGMVRLSAIAAVTAAASLVLLADEGAWFSLVMLPTAVSVLAYFSAIQAALAYGEAVCSAFDLHRFDLLTALHLPLPEDSDHERTLSTALCLRWRQGVINHDTYNHVLSPR